jgi:hypothetical protein
MWRLYGFVVLVGTIGVTLHFLSHGAVLHALGSAACALLLKWDLGQMAKGR